MATSLRLMPIVLASLVLGQAPAQAETPVCNNSPGTGERIECTQDDTSTSDIDIDALGINIDTSGYSEYGIYGFHQGAGNIDIDVSADASGEQPVRSTIDTTGQRSHGVYGKHEGTDGNVDIQVDSTDITTTSDHTGGIHSFIDASGNGDISIETSQSTIDTAGNFGYGVSGHHNGVGDLIITLQQGSEIDTMGLTSYAVRGFHRGDGESVINLGEGVDIYTTGTGASGVYLRNESTNTGSTVVTVNGSIIKTEGSQAEGIWNTVQGGTGDSRTEVRNSTVTTMGYGSYGIYGYHTGLGDIDIFLQDSSVTTESTDLDPIYADTFSHGIYARHQSIGDIEIDLQGGSIETKGLYSYGVYARHQGDGDITIGTRNGHAITTTGDYGHGISAQNEGTMDTRTISIIVRGTIDTEGIGAQGIRVGTVNASSEPERMAAIGTDGYRRQTVTVNGSVTSAAEGVYLAGGGKVVIGPQGSIDSESGIAILATGEVPEDATDPNNVIPAIQPKLRVDLNLGGRQVVEALGDNWIINDGGETTIAVNHTVLHEGVTGIVTDAVAHNGAWNVRMREEGVTVNRDDPANWVISDPAVGIIADRDFSTADFNETRRPTPPPPVPPVPPVPEAQVHMVETSIIGGADDVAGIHIEGDGMVHIGPMGSVGAQSGIAILATQDTSGPLSNSGSEGLVLGDVIGGDGVLRSASAVSEIATLTTGDGPKLIVDMDLDGRSVQDVIGDDWIINDGGETTIIVNGVTLHEGATGIVTDAVAPNGAFDVAMIGEGVMVTDRTGLGPADWMISDPTLGVIVDRDFSAEDFLYLPTSGGSPMLVEEYAPRAAVYEALPGFLLRLGGGGPFGKRTSSLDSPVWVRLSGGRGSYEAERVSVGAEYDYDHYSVEAGKDISLGENAMGTVFVHHISGSADVSSPTKGGKIDAEGIGLTLGVSVNGPSAYYATGGFSLTSYDMDLFSDELGRLETGVGARAHTLDLEVGRRVTTSGGVNLTPRMQLMHSEVDVENFTDAVDARVSGVDAARVTASLGVAAETALARNWWGGAVSLRGSVDLAQTLGGTKTSVDVSGEELSSQPDRTRFM